MTTATASVNTVAASYDEIVRRVCLRDFKHVDTRGDELVTRAAFLNYHEATIVLERRYGREPGRRLVVLTGNKSDCGACAGKPDRLHVESDDFIPAPVVEHPTTTIEHIAPSRRPMVKTNRKPYRDPILPLRGSNLVWHIIAVNDKRIIATCDTEDDAILVARAVGWGTKCHVMTRRGHEYESGLVPR